MSYCSNLNIIFEHLGVREQLELRRAEELIGEKGVKDG